MRTVLAIAGSELRRFLADKSNIFFVFIFPLLLVFVIGSQFGGAGSTTGRVVVTGPDSPLHTAMVNQLETAGIEVSSAAGADQLREAVARGEADVGVLIPQAADAAYQDGGQVALEMVTGSSAQAPAVVQIVNTAADGVQLAAGQIAALEVTGASPEEIRAALEATDLEPAQVVVQREDGLSEAFAGLSGMFDLGASSQLLLFVFLTTLTASVTLIQARRNGVITRMMAAPVSAGQAISGLALGRLAVALFQGLYIIVATRLIFGVDWGNLWVVLVLLTVFGLIGAGGAVIIGSVIDNEGAAVGISVGGGLVLGAIGGAMVPLEIFPETLRQVAKVTPHAWAYEAFAEIQRRGGGLLEIAPQLGVLALMAVLVLGIGSMLLRRSLARAM